MANTDIGGQNRHLIGHTGIKFSVFVLDCSLDLPSTSRKRDLLKAMDGHILQHAVLIGHYR